MESDLRHDQPLLGLDEGPRQDAGAAGQDYRGHQRPPSLQISRVWVMLVEAGGRLLLVDV